MFLTRPNVCTGLVLATLILAALPAWCQLADSSWPKYHADGRNSGATTIVGAGGTLQWSYAGYGGLEGAGVAVGPDGAVYATTRGGVTALNPDGTLRWDFIGGYSDGTVAIARDGTVYYGSPWGRLFAINPDGTMKWGYTFSGGIVKSSPTIDENGNVYFATTAGFLYSFRGDTGDVNWTKPVGAAVYSSPAIGPDGNLYFANADGYLYAVDPSGNHLWHRFVGDAGYASPAIGTDGIIYIATSGSDASLLAVKPSGKIIWSQTIGGGTNGAPAISPSGKIYLIDQESVLRAFTIDGSPLWTYAAPGIVSAAWSSPIVDGAETIYFTGRTAGYDIYLLAVNADGTERWRSRVPWGLVATPAIGPGGQIYTGGGTVSSFVPEPSPLLALLAGIAACFRRLRRRQTTSQILCHSGASDRSATITKSPGAS